MLRLLLILTILLGVSSVAAQNPSVDSEDKTVSPVARADVEKKYDRINKNLTSIVKRKLSFITTKLNKTVRNGRKDSDYYTIARTEIKKQFSLATTQQLDVLIFYTLTIALKHVEKDIDHLSKQQAETSTMFGNLSVKASLIFNVVSTVLTNIRGTDARTFKTII
ncbi:MAG: hypothetical protein GY847_04445 [Proteobacteria bacterium]|nr:hypothetical protein [Pseudomonadota bacterium]